MLAFGGLCTSAQMAAVKLYRRRAGQSLSACAYMQIFSGAAVFAFFLIKNSLSAGRFTLGFTPYSLVIALLYTSCSFSATVVGIKVTGRGNLGMFSMFAVLGGMLVPAFIGILFFNEQVTVFKAIGMAFMIAAIVFPSARSFGQKSDLYCTVLYFAAFVIYGVGAGLVFIQQNPVSYETMSADGFLSLYGLILSLGSVICTVCTRPASDEITKLFPAWRRSGALYVAAPILIAVSSGLLVGLANNMSMLAMAPGGVGAVMAASVLNGCAMVFSYLFGILIFGESVNRMQTAATVMAVCAAAMFAF